MIFTIALDWLEATSITVFFMIRILMWWYRVFEYHGRRNYREIG